MDSRRRSSEQLRDAYRVPGFTPCHTVTGVQGDPHVRVVTLRRRVKKRSAARVERRIARGIKDRQPRRVRDLPCGDVRVYLAFDLRCVDCRQCSGVTRERLEWLSMNPHYTKRFAWYVGKQCCGASVQEVASDLRLDWHAVKEMDKLYLREHLAVADVPQPTVIGMDEISTRKGHVYRIIASDLELG